MYLLVVDAPALDLAIGIAVGTFHGLFVVVLLSLSLFFGNARIRFVAAVVNLQ